MFSVDIIDPWGNVTRTEQLRLRPKWFAAAAVGGPEAAEVEVSGPADAVWQITQWLQHRVLIRNGNGTLCWWGFIERATVGMGQAQIGGTLEGMANRIQVAYTFEGVTGSQERETTAWAQVDRSVYDYGRFEERLSLADVNQAEAETKRGTALARRAFPLPVTELNENPGGYLTCRGWWTTLERIYYADERGTLKHDVSPDIEHVIGWALLSQTDIGMKGARIDDLSARLVNTRGQNPMRVVGSGAGNDGVYEVETPPDDETEAVTFVSDNVFFDPTDDIKNDFNEFTWAEEGFMIRTWGSSRGSNNGTFWIEKASPGGIEVDFHGISQVSDDGPITIKQGHGVTLVEEVALTREQIGVSISLYHGSYKIAQKFRITSAAGWTVNRVRVQVKKLGAPADNLRVRIYSDSSGSPSAILAEGLVAPALVSDEDLAWLTADLGSGAALSPATDYWLSVDRTGGPSTVDLYLVGLESEATYSYPLKVYDGYTSTWLDRTPNAHMPFQLVARTATTAQIAEMLAAAPWLAGVSLRTASGVDTDLYRDGEQKLLTEVERLLEMGTSTNGALHVRVLEDRTAVIEAAPESGDGNLRMDARGTLRQAMGQPLEEGVLPAGQWVTLDGAPAGMNALASFLIDRAEFDAENKRMRLEPRPIDYD